MGSRGPPGPVGQPVSIFICLRVLFLFIILYLLLEMRMTQASDKEEKVFKQITLK